MDKVVSVAQMRGADGYTIENFIDSRDLMYRAGEAVFRSVNWVSPVGIVCGTGNNAGDGYVLASLLRAMGMEVTLLLIEKKFSEDGKFYYDACKMAGIEDLVIDRSTRFDEYAILVDCIYGTGFHGSVPENVDWIIEKINQSSAARVSVDINSGMNGDTGEGDCCVESDLTVSIGFTKQGQLTEAGRKKIGKLKTVDIGIILKK